jgi:hypothetical protein
MMDRETWLRRILDATRDLADERYQERVWVRGEGPEVDSSTEALIRLIDDDELAAFIAEAAKKGWVSNEQLAALRSLDAALARYAPVTRAVTMRPASRVENGSECESLPKRRSIHSRHPQPAHDFLLPPVGSASFVGPLIAPLRRPWEETR